jgi:hypothetical protein
MTIPQSSTRTRRLRARAKKHQIFFSEKKKKKNTREERIQTFFSFPRTTREDEKEEKQRDKERFSSLTERGENHSFSSSAIRVSIPRAITAAASVAARVYSFVVCNRACVSRASERVYRHHYSLYIRSFCVLSLLLFGGQKFLSFSLSLSPKRQTDRHKLCDHSSERDTRRERGKGVASASLLFSFFSKAIRKFCVVTLLREKEIRNDVKASSTSKLD